MFSGRSNKCKKPKNGSSDKDSVDGQGSTENTTNDQDASESAEDHSEHSGSEDDKFVHSDGENHSDDGSSEDEMEDFNCYDVGLALANDKLREEHKELLKIGFHALIH